MSALTQQQGGEQEARDVERQARELLAAEYAKLHKEEFGPPRDLPIDHRKVVLRTITTALRSKQAAPSEGDDEAARVRLSNDIHGVYGNTTKAMADHLWQLGYRLNTSKQAAGEAVAYRNELDALVRELRGSRSIHVDCTVVADSIESAMEAADAEIECGTTPPRHPAEEGLARDAARFVWLATFWNEPYPLTPEVAEVLAAFKAGDLARVRTAIDAALAGSP